MDKADALRLTTLVVAVALLAGSTPTLAGCGEKVAEEKIEQQIEEALGSDGADVKVDIEDDSGSIDITGDDGDAQVSFGGAASVPDDFPKDLLPGDADIQSAITTGEGGGSMQTVTFTSGKDTDEMYEWFLDALPKAGYKVEQKMQFDSAGGKGFTISGSGTGTGCNVTGSEADGKFMYSVMIVAQ